MYTVQSLPPPGFSPGLAAFLSVQKSNTYPASIPNILPRIYIQPQPPPFFPHSRPASGDRFQSARTEAAIIRLYTVAGPWGHQALYTYIQNAPYLSFQFSNRGNFFFFWGGGVQKRSYFKYSLLRFFSRKLCRQQGVTATTDGLEPGTTISHNSSKENVTDCILRHAEIIQF